MTKRTRLRKDRRKRTKTRKDTKKGQNQEKTKKDKNKEFLLAHWLPQQGETNVQKDKNEDEH